MRDSSFANRNDWNISQRHLSITKLLANLGRRPHAAYSGAPKVITDLHPGAQERKPMIRTEIIGSNVIRITAPDKLERADFEHLAPRGR